MKQNILNPDVSLQTWMSWMIDMTEKKSKLRSKKWQKGQPLSLLFVGYTGTRNTGADVRVSEMIRQIRHILGPAQSNLSIVTIDPTQTKDYFPNVSQLHIPKIFPPFLYKSCPDFDGVIACEGSMFKSKFADALSTMMAGALGMANAEDKISIGYGAEAGQMNSGLASFVKKQCKKSLVVCRNQASEKILEDLEIRTAPGTDTAWTFPIPDPAIGKSILTQHGWDGKKPVVAICPIDPFCWPVRPSISKTLKKFVLGQDNEDHYQSIYFHDINAEKQKAFQTYIQNISNALKRFEEKNDVFPILVGMERLDRKACQAISDTYTKPLPMFISDDFLMDEMVSILHQASALVSSRFHAIVCSMIGIVPSAGITMDERITNLLSERGDVDLLMKVDQTDLEQRVFESLTKLFDQSEEIKTRIRNMIPREIKKMGQMGMAFSDEVSRIYPDFVPSVTSESWQDYIPELSPATKELLEN